MPAVAAASSPLRPLPRPRPLPLRAASGEEGGDAAGEGGKAGAAGKKRRRKVPLPAELLEAQQEQEEKVEEQKAAAPVSAAPVSAAPARSREEELAERLKQDIARFKAVEQAEAKPGAEEEVGGLAGLGQKASSALEKVLVADFFVVLAFLAWFLTGVVFKSVFDDRSVLDGFNAIWTPVIQPALGMCVWWLVDSTRSYDAHSIGS